VAFEIRVLGSEPAWPSASRACSGYLVLTARSVLLIDCGTGVFERLRAVCAPEELTGVLISHLHFDHWLDLLPLRYYLKYEASPNAPLPLHLPPGALEKLKRIAEQVDPTPRFFDGAFTTSEYDPKRELTTEDLSVTFHRTRHPIETYAFALVSEGRRLVYTADTGRDESLIHFARGADLLVCDATWGASDGDETMHLSANSAGQMAAAAGARRLLLTHLAEPKADEAVRVAQKEYGGPVAFAKGGRDFLV
jgi:ribonuclease BN (tRNA processing enzyme)